MRKGAAGPDCLEGERGCCLLRIRVNLQKILPRATSHATCNVQLRQPTSCMLPNHCLSESGRWLAKKSFHGTWRLFFTASFFQYLRIGVAGELLILVNSLFSLEICKVVCLKIFRMAVLVLIFRFAPCATYRVFFKLVPP